MCGLGEEMYYFRRRSRERRDECGAMELISDGAGDGLGGGVLLSECTGDRLGSIL